METWRGLRKSENIGMHAVHDRRVVSTIDYLRGQVACSLSAFNLALLFLCRALR